MATSKKKVAKKATKARKVVKKKVVRKKKVVVKKGNGASRPPGFGQLMMTLDRVYARTVTGPQMKDGETIAEFRKRVNYGRGIWFMNVSGCGPHTVQKLLRELKANYGKKLKFNVARLDGKKKPFPTKENRYMMPVCIEYEGPQDVIDECDKIVQALFPGPQYAYQTRGRQKTVQAEDELFFAKRRLGVLKRRASAS